jgi:hypothetical protein
MSKFIMIERPAGIFETEKEIWCDIVSLDENNVGTVWVHGVEKDKAVIILNALNAAGI